MSLASKLKTLFWYLRKPAYYGQLINLVIQRLKKNPKENTRAEAEKWCTKHCIETDEFLTNLTGKPVEQIEDLFKAEFKKAHEAADQAPVKMGGPGNMELVYHLCDHLKAEKVIETGVAYGWSTLALLLTMNKRQGAKLISIDLPYAKMGNEDYVGCVVPADLRGSWELIREPDRKALPGALSKLDHLDLCHYDSDKTYEGRMWAYPKLWNKLKPGGYFVSDDIGDNVAFRDFCTSINRKPTVIKFRNQFVGLIEK